MNIAEIINRLKLFFGLKTNKQLAKKLGILDSTLSNWKRDKKFDFVELFPILKDIDFEWLIKGEKPFQNDIATETSITTANFFVLNIPPVVLIPEKAQAGYLAEFGQYENEELPIMIHHKYKDGRKYRFFEISGDSMEPNIWAGDYVLCEKKEKQEIKQGKVYVLYTKGGFICKRLDKISNSKEKNIDMHSDNAKYAPKELLKEDILEIWEVMEINRKVK